jgi:hypothetical protein
MGGPDASALQPDPGACISKMKTTFVHEYPLLRRSCQSLLIFVRLAGNKEPTSRLEPLI